MLFTSRFNLICFYLCVLYSLSGEGFSKITSQTDDVNNIIIWDYKNPNLTPISVRFPAIELDDTDEYTWRITLKNNENSERFGVTSECSCFSANIYPVNKNNIFDWALDIKKTMGLHGDVINRFILHDESNHIKLVDVSIFILPKNGYYVDFNKVYSDIKNINLTKKYARVYASKKNLANININSSDYDIKCKISKSFYFDNIVKMYFRQISIDTKKTKVNRFHSVNIVLYDKSNSYNVFVPLK